MRLCDSFGETPELENPGDSLPGSIYGEQLRLIAGEVEPRGEVGMWPLFESRGGVFTSVVATLVVLGIVPVLYIGSFSLGEPVFKSQEAIFCSGWLISFSAPLLSPEEKLLLLVFMWKFSSVHTPGGDLTTVCFLPHHCLDPSLLLLV